VGSTGRTSTSQEKEKEGSMLGWIRGARVAEGKLWTERGLCSFIE
jgi:hypothetical protein